MYWVMFTYFVHSNFDPWYEIKKDIAEYLKTVLNKSNGRALGGENNILFTLITAETCGYKIFVSPKRKERTNMNNWPTKSYTWFYHTAYLVLKNIPGNECFKKVEGKAKTE